MFGSETGKTIHLSWGFPDKRLRSAQNVNWRGLQSASEKEMVMGMEHCSFLTTF